MEDKHVFFVESTDGRKFKMVMKGDFGKLSVAKIHRYLKTYGVPEGQLLTYRGVVLQDDMLGEDFGLASNITLQLRDPAGATAAARPRSGVVEVAPPNRRATMSSQTSMSVSQSGEVVAENAHLKEELNAWKLQVQRLEAQMRQQQDEMHQLRKSSATAAPPRAGSTSAASSYTSVESDPLKNAKDNLEHLSRKLGVPLQFDVNLTCIIGSDEDYTILVSFDPDTERLYMYSTLLHSLPDAPDVRVKLYEVLLEGSLLGREVCGGSLSVSLREGIVVLTTSLVMGHSDSTALCTVMPHFVNTLSRWRSIVHELV